MPSFTCKYEFGKILALTHGGELVRVLSVGFQEATTVPMYVVRKPCGTMVNVFESELDDNDPIAARESTTPTPPPSEG